MKIKQYFLIYASLSSNKPNKSLKASKLLYCQLWIN